MKKREEEKDVCVLHLAVDHVLDGGDDVVGALDDGLFHLAGVRHGGVLHAETHDGGVELVEEVLGDDGGEGGADAAGARGFVENAELVGCLLYTSPSPRDPE